MFPPPPSPTTATPVSSPALRGSAIAAAATPQLSGAWPRHRSPPRTRKTCNPQPRAPRLPAKAKMATPRRGREREREREREEPPTLDQALHHRPSPSRTSTPSSPSSPYAAPPPQPPHHQSDITSHPSHPTSDSSDHHSYPSRPIINHPGFILSSNHQLHKLLSSTTTTTPWPSRFLGALLLAHLLLVRPPTAVANREL
jgi:hypothetical protein